MTYKESVIRDLQDKARNWRQRRLNPETLKNEVYLHYGAGLITEKEQEALLSEFQ
jgi:hypothetical protein